MIRCDHCMPRAYAFYHYHCISETVGASGARHSKKICDPSILWERAGINPEHLWLEKTYILVEIAKLCLVVIK